MLWFSRSLGAFAVLTTLTALAPVPAIAQEIRTYSKKADYDDVRFELTNAIIDRGLTIDYNGHIGKMLDHAANAPVGAPVMMEADAMNIAFCPYVVFIYESVGEPGVVVVGYRRPSGSGSPETKAALAELDALLGGITKEALQ